MASSQRRMNELWRTAALLLLCTLLLTSKLVSCQDDAAADATVAPDAPDAVNPTATALSSAAPGTGATPAGDAGDSGAASLTPGDGPSLFTVNTVVLDGDSLSKTSAPITGGLELNTIEEDGGGSPPSSSGSSVFVGILVSGLLAALAITIGYFKCQRRPEKKAVRLAEEAYPVDQENQGNTLVSVAPLNPPPETPEKPSANGESTEAPKDQTPPPPTNGHSTAKAADTEL